MNLSFSWDLHWSCNYRCPYCWWHNRWDDLGKRNVYPGTDKLIEVWKRIHDKYGEAHISIAGGEPTIYPDFWQFIEKLLKYHRVNIATNLSGDIDYLLNDMNDGELLKRLTVGCTFHPLFADINQFTSKVKKILDKKVTLSFNYLPYPPQIKEIPKLKEKFREFGVEFLITTFWGTYNGKQYPQSYTDEELSIIDPILATRKGEKFQTKPVVTKGKLCNAGRTYGIIHPNGEVLRCGGGSWKGESIIIGNIFDDNFSLADEPKPCDSEFCPCNEWAMLLVDKSAQATHTDK
jgi:MoaA/NifB/PqqE/SkfB family radical SAM enzyme